MSFSANLHNNGHNIFWAGLSHVRQICQTKGDMPGFLEGGGRRNNSEWPNGFRGGKKNTNLKSGE